MAEAVKVTPAQRQLLGRIGVAWTITRARRSTLEALAKIGLLEARCVPGDYRKARLTERGVAYRREMT